MRYHAQSEALHFSNGSIYTHAMVVHKAQRMRLRPTRAQAALMHRIAGCTRFVFNLFLQQRQDLYRAHAAGGHRDQPSADVPPLHRVGAIDQMGQVSALRAQFPFLEAAPFHALQQAAVDVDDAFQRFFAGQTRHPRWRTRDDRQRFRFPDPKQLHCNERTIRLPKLGEMRWNLSRPSRGQVRSVTVSFDGDHWYASVATLETIAEPEAPAGPAVAIDVGIRVTATLSTGAVFQAPVATAAERRRLRIRQRRVSRRQRRSRNQRRALRRYRTTSRRITNRTHHAHHVFTAALAQTHGVIVVEDLRLTAMCASAAGTVAEPGRMVRQKAGLNRSLRERALGELRRQLAYKTAWHGSRLVAVPAPYSSQTCAACGQVAAASRCGPLFACVACGHADDADHHAAVVLLARAASGTGRDITASIVPRDTRKRVPSRKAATNASGDTTTAITGGSSAQEPAPVCA